MRTVVSISILCNLNNAIEKSTAVFEAKNNIIHEPYLELEQEYHTAEPTTVSNDFILLIMRVLFCIMLIFILLYLTINKILGIRQLFLQILLQ